MALERERTRRLAMAMALQLEKQVTERAAARENEAATDRAIAAQRRGERPASAGSSTSDARAGSSTAAPAAPVAAPSAAQRFMLVPGPAEPGSSRVTTAVVRRPEEDARERAALLGPDLAAAPLVAQNAPAAPIAANAGVPVISRLIDDEDAPEPTPARTPAPAPASAPAVASRSVAAAAPVAAASTNAPAPAVARRDGELDVISAFVGRVLDRDDAAAALSLRSSALEGAYARLIEQEVGRELAERILRQVADEMRAAIEAGEEPSEAEVRQAVERRIAALLPVDEALAEHGGFRVGSGRNGARRIAFVGPTGVGKTTTLAKIAAQLKLKHGLRVGIIAADTYRIAAVDQLRTYAEILELPVEVAASPADAARACARLADLDCILIDTAGRSQNDRMKISELRAFLAAAEPDETHLVLSATAGGRTLAREAEAFCPLGVDRVVFTKLDEAASFGTLVALIERIGKQVSFLTHGQEVPDHIEAARGQRLAALVMGGEVR